MAAVEACRAHVRELVRDAASNCSRAYVVLADVDGSFESPMRAADLLSHASRKLAASAFLMGAAELLALHGAPTTPEAPLRSVRDIVDPDLRFALGKLRDARAQAEDARGAAELGRSHLWATNQLLGYPRLPGVDSFLDAAGGTARGWLDVARVLARGSAALANTAHLRLR